MLRSLVDGGWRLGSSEGLVCLPKGDDDAFAWSTFDGPEEDFWGLVETKATLGETVGVVLYWSQSSAGGEFLLVPDGSLIFTPSVNRVNISDLNASDVTWYVTRIISAVAQSGAEIESWEWSED